MIRQYYLGNHTPVICGLLESSHNTIKLARDAARKLHTEKCQAPDCDYEAEVAWAVYGDEKNLEIDLEDFYDSNIAARRVSIKASVHDVFYSCTSQLVFTPRERPLYPCTMAMRPSASPITSVHSREESAPSLKRKTPDYELEDSSSDDAPFRSFSPLSFVSMSSTESEPSNKRRKNATFDNRHGSVFSHSEARCQRLPGTLSDFRDIVQNHFLYVDKSPILDLLDSWVRGSPQIPIVRCPRGYGLRTLTSMIEAMFSHSKDYTTFFDSLAITTEEHWRPSFAGFGPNEMLVLRLNLEDPSLLEDDFSTALRRYVESQIAEIYRSAGTLIDRRCRWNAWNSLYSPGMAVGSFAKFLRASGSPPLYVIVENATSPLRSLPENSSEVLETFFSDLAHDHTSTFAGVVVTDYLEQDGFLRPEPLSSIFFQEIGYYVDATTHPDVQQCLGFTRREIEDLVAVLDEVALPGMPDIWEMLQSRGVRGRAWTPRADAFGYEVEEPSPVFSMEGVLQTLAVRCGQDNQRFLQA